MNNLAIAVDILLKIIANAGNISAIIMKAKAEGRDDISNEELDIIFKHANDSIADAEAATDAAEAKAKGG